VCTYESTGDEGCCALDTDCNDEDFCTTDTCDLFNCTFTPIEGCCHESSECDDANTCTANTCEEQVCVTTWLDTPECCNPTVLVATFDAPVSGDIEPGTSPDFILGPADDGVGWHIAGGTGESSIDSLALYFGNPLLWNFDNGQTVKGEATSPMAHLVPEKSVSVSFDVWAATNVSPFNDVFSVEILTDGQEEDGTQIWTKSDVGTGNFNTWHSVEINVDAHIVGSETLRVRFIFDSKNKWFNADEGLYFDNIQINTDCSSGE
jgi:hypothetical protein